MKNDCYTLNRPEPSPELFINHWTSSCNGLKKPAIVLSVVVIALTAFVTLNSPIVFKHVNHTISSPKELDPLIKVDKFSKESFNTTKCFEYAVLLTSDEIANEGRGLPFWQFEYSRLSRELAQDYNLSSHVVNNNAEVCNALEKTHIALGKTIDVLVIRGHGTPAGVILSRGREGSKLSSENVEDISECFKEHLTKDAPILLYSCSTGEDVPGGINFATKLAAATGHPVQAPTQTLVIKDCRIEPDNITRYPNMNCVRSDDNLMPGEKLGEYVRLFNPPYKIV